MPKIYLELPNASAPTKEVEDLLALLTLKANAYHCPSCGTTIKAEGEPSERKCDKCATIMVGVLLASDSEGEAAYKKEPCEYEIVDDMMIIRDVPIINTGYWNYRRFDKIDLESMVEEWGNKQKDLVADHLDDVSTLWGVSRKPRLIEENGIYTIVANLLITTDTAIQLILSLEKVGKKLQISPSITWEIIDGKEMNAKIIHVAAVLRGAQGEAAELSKEEVVTKKNKKKDTVNVNLENKKLKEEEEEKIEEKKEEEKIEEEKKEEEEEESKKEEKEQENEEETEQDPDKKKEKEEEEVDPDNDSPISSLSGLQEEIGHVLGDADATTEALKSFLLKVNEFLSKWRKTQEEKDEKEKDKDDDDDDDTLPDKKEAKESAEAAVGSLMATSSAHVRTRTVSEKLEDNVYKKELLFPTICVLPQSRDWRAQVAINIDEDMIDNIMVNFESLGSKVPVFIGHVPVGEEDKHLDQAVGWITKLSKEDGKLFALRLEITNKDIQSRVDDKTLQDASVGMLFSYIDSEGKQIGPVLRHLGVVAIGLFKGMKGFEKLAASDEIPEGEVTLEPLEISSSQLDKLREELEDTRNKQVKFAEQYASLSSKLLDIRKEDLDKRILDLIAKGVIKPAYKDMLKELVNKSAEIGSNEDKIAERFLELLSDGVVEADLSKPKVDASEAAEFLAASDRHYISKSELDTEKFRRLYRAGKVEQDDRCMPYCQNIDWK